MAVLCAVDSRRSYIPSRKVELSMGKISDLEIVIKDLHSVSSIINEVINNLAEMLSTALSEEAQDAVLPTQPTLTLEQVRAVLAEKSRAGYTAEIRSLLQKYGADRLSAIDSAKYKALLDEAEVIGNA